jgi:formylglycine-generating enzyme required for sulfatase activity
VAGPSKAQGDDQTQLLEATGATAADHVASDSPSAMLGQVVGRYQIRRLLGAGGMGSVYLARDSVLGRSVALKLVGGWTRGTRFLDEARAIAQLNHPNIVQLFDFGSHDRGLYLALEYIEGETLRERMQRGSFTLAEALRHTRAIAEALDHAHAAGIYHCDLKPGNVIIGRDGRIRVVDFGIARTAQDRWTAGGTPDWMAPEQWRNGEVAAGTDIWALAIVCTQLVTGEHPLGRERERRHELARTGAHHVALETLAMPATLQQLVALSLDPDLKRRPSARAWVAAIDDVLVGQAELLDDGPYPGLAAFDEDHSRWFFGREAEVDELVERLHTCTQLPIVGSSGAGKSSFLHAGVIPRLRAREAWTVISFRPGNDPVGALARAVLGALGETPQRGEVQWLREELLETPTLLAARLTTLAAASRANILLAVDQLEELFTHGASELERNRFLAMTAAAVDDASDPARVVYTVRDDFVGKISGLRSLFVLQKLGTQDLRRAIETPLARCNYELDPGIVDDLLSEIGTADADLPLLQFACRTLWDGRDRAARRIRRVTYEEMGGLAGALARHAQHAVSELTPSERRTARQLLLQLVAGTARRSVARVDLVGPQGDREAGRVLDGLIAARLLVQRSQDDVAIVEIAHESLLESWEQLARWIHESRDERRLLQELEDATVLWQRRGQRAEETWSAADIATARHRATQLDLVLPSHVEQFLVAGEARHRAARRRRRIGVGITLAAIGTIAVIVFILIGRYLAREELIRTNAGTIDLVLAPFDWTGTAEVPVSVAALPELSWRLYGIGPDSEHRQGTPLPDDVVDVLSTKTDGTRRIDRVRAPGGMAFLEVRGRGRAGERCGSSWIRLRAIPGYAGTHGVPRFELRVPTCQATRANTVVVPAGPFIYGGPGVPASRHDGEADYTLPERQIELPRFRIDRTEVSNGAFAPFAAMAQVTGYPVPVYSAEPLHANDGKPNYPVTELDMYQAEAFCRFLGKSLPRDVQWVKAARGGIVIDGAPNPEPRRLYPWGSQARPECTNADGLQDGFDWISPVDALACGASPYGVLGLVGNVQEWIADAPASTPGHRILRGGGADSPPDLEHTTTVFVNHRDPRRFSYGFGFRCVIDEEERHAE